MGLFGSLQGTQFKKPASNILGRLLVVLSSSQLLLLLLPDLLESSWLTFPRLREV